MIKNDLHRAIIARGKEMINDEQRFGAGSLFTSQPQVNASRLIMVNHHLGHMINLIDPDVPLVSTGYENTLANFTSMNKKSESDFEVIEIFEKNKYSYLMLVKDLETGVYDIVERKEIEIHSEDAATRYNNKFIDSLEVGNTIPKDAMMVKSSAFDKYGNYRFGKLLNVVYSINIGTMEDGIILMNDADKMMSCIKGKLVRVAIADNDVLLNLMGDEDNYKAFPGIGDEIIDNILLATRRIDSEKSPYSLKSKNLMRIEDGDMIKYESGKVIDINIYTNKTLSEFKDSNTLKQFKKLYKKQIEFTKLVHSRLDEVIKNEKYTPYLSRVYKNMERALDPNCYYTDDSEGVFGNTIIEFIIEEEYPMVIGSKLVGVVGNKGVVADIKSLKDSWWTSDGVPIHAVLDALQIVGRNNPYQSTCVKTTHMSKRTTDWMAKCDSLKEQIQILLDYIHELNPDEAKKLKRWISGMDNNEKEIFIHKVIKNGINVVYPPLEVPNLEDLERTHKMLEKRGVDLSPTKIVFPDGSKTLRKSFVSQAYMMRLKQDPADKYSIRGRGNINIISQLPSKSAAKKRNLELHADTPVRFGVYETLNLMICNQPVTVSAYMKINSTSPEARELTEDIYTADITEEIVFEQLDEVSSPKKNREMVDGHIAILGTRIVIHHEDDDKDNLIKLKRKKK